MKEEIPMLPLFEQFIKDSLSGKRMKPNGEKIKPQTVYIYRYVFNYLKEFSQQSGFELRIKPIIKPNKKEYSTEFNYWKKFYLRFSSFLVKNKNCYDNYIGLVFKIVRIFFNYLKKEKFMQVGDFYRNFHVRKEEIPVITFMPEQLQFLIYNKPFEKSLPLKLRYIKEMVVFGCSVALRCSDLLNLRYRDIETIAGQTYLVSKSIKTEMIVRVKLPDYAIDIVNKHRKAKSADAKIFKRFSKNQINLSIRKLTELAGWTHIVGKTRKQNGKSIEIYKGKKENTYRFCDLVSSHVMRRTAITTMLMLGMSEHVVKRISGHSVNSKTFYRYVNFVQSYLDEEIDKVHRKLSTV